MNKRSTLFIALAGFLISSATTAQDISLEQATQLAIAPTLNCRWGLLIYRRIPLR